VILSPQFGVQIKSHVRPRSRRLQEITKEQWEQRPISERMKEFGASVWSRLL
jgi:cardiolipin synthase